MFLMLPLLAVSLVIYIIAAVGSNVAGGEEAAFVFDQELFSVAMMSGDIWVINWGHAFIIFSMGLLFAELLRATQTGAGSIINHALSMVVFVVALLLFVLLPGFGNSYFFIFMCMALIDVMAGFIVTIVSARRDFGVTEGALGSAR